MCMLQPRPANHRRRIRFNKVTELARTYIRTTEKVHIPWGAAFDNGAPEVVLPFDDGSIIFIEKIAGEWYAYDRMTIV